MKPKPKRDRHNEHYRLWARGGAANETNERIWKFRLDISIAQKKTEEDDKEFKKKRNEMNENAFGKQRIVSQFSSSFIVPTKKKKKKK